MDRVKSFYNEIVKRNDASTAIQIQRKTQKGIVTEAVQPISQSTITFKDSVGSLIGLHENIIAIVAWEVPTAKDEQNQLFGRILRLNGWGNPLTFYIATNSISYE